jgi:pimeloyl-ACP methyl ester carboxylesterase
VRLALRGVAAGVAVAIALTAPAARAAQVENLSALHSSGQTFLTWTSPPGTGWIFRVYASQYPLRSPGDLAQATSVGVVGDSTWYDRRFSVITGAVTSYRVDPLAEPLGPDQGLCVLTPVTSGRRFYAVTAQLGPIMAEDRSLIAGVNALPHPVTEHVDRPEPVFQRQLTNRFNQPAVYTLWSTDTPTPMFPAMSNVAGVPFDLAVVPPADMGTSSLIVSMHARTGNFMQGIYGTWTPGEWVLALDDPLNNSDANTFWYGYHEGYNIDMDVNPPPTGGVVHDYTLQRVIYSLEWAERKFSINRTRVYAYGFSMGGIGSAMLAMRRPDLIAAIMTIAAKFDFSFINDPNPLSGFNIGNSLRATADRLWGPLDVDLPNNNGVSIYHALNDGWLAGAMTPVAVPPIIAFNGKNDFTTGWAEKIPFYRDMQGARQGGTFFWDMRDHLSNSDAPWSPTQDFRYLYRFRTDLSFPALSNCSADNDPGDGNPAVGDSVGCINGWVEWDTTAIDQNLDWGTRLWTRSLPRQEGLIAGPESVTVDVTPRRLQNFRVLRGEQYHCTVVRDLDGALLRDEMLTPDGYGLLTIRQATVYRSGTTLHLQAQSALAVESSPAAPGHIRLALTRNPIGPLTAVELSWPAAGPARVDLMDVSGRIVRTLLNGPAAAGPVRLTLSSRDLGAGVYFLVASQRGERAVQRAVVLR